MAKGFKHGAGGGGNPLNFSVVGNPQPENPKENTIWLDTDVPIGAWYFSATQPENMAEGEVWFPTGTSSSVEFNALKKGTIQVYPISAKQMVDDGLVDVTAKSYQGGEWVDWWNGELYTPGEQYESVTGGWSSAGYNRDGGTSNISTATFTSTCMIFDSNNPGGVFNVAGTQKKIDLSKFNYLTVKGTLSSKNGNYGLYTRVLTSKNFYPTPAASALCNTVGDFSINIPLTGLNGEYYILFATDGISGIVGEVYEVRLS